MHQRESRDLRLTTKLKDWLPVLFFIPLAQLISVIANHLDMAAAMAFGALSLAALGVWVYRNAYDMTYKPTLYRAMGVILMAMAAMHAVGFFYFHH